MIIFFYGLLLIIALYVVIGTLITLGYYLKSPLWRDLIESTKFISILLWPQFIYIIHKNRDYFKLL